jgi:hypothetical protein
MVTGHKKHIFLRPTNLVMSSANTLLAGTSCTGTGTTIVLGVVLARMPHDSLPVTWGESMLNELKYVYIYVPGTVLYLYQRTKVCTTVEKKNSNTTNLWFCFKVCSLYDGGVLSGDPPPSPVVRHSAREEVGGGGSASQDQCRPCKRAESLPRRFTPPVQT